MLKNKKAIYILIPLNLAIWGFFIYRFYTAYNEYDGPPPNEKITAIKLDDIRDSVTYKLNLDYKDPFLRENEKYRNTAASSVPVKMLVPKIAIAKTPTVAPKQLPDIKYLGLIKNSNSGAATAIISLNGQSKLIKANDVIDGIVFRSFDKNELVAVWGKEKMVIRK
jgi:hypothetical protein